MCSRLIVNQWSIHFILFNDILHKQIDESPSTCRFNCRINRQRHFAFSMSAESHYEDYTPPFAPSAICDFENQPIGIVGVGDRTFNRRKVYNIDENNIPTNKLTNRLYSMKWRPIFLYDSQWNFTKSKTNRIVTSMIEIIFSWSLKISID